MVTFILNQAAEKELLDFFRTRTRLERAVDLVDYVEQIGPEVFQVPSLTRPRLSTVDLAGPSCDCTDWTH